MYQTETNRKERSFGQFHQHFETKNECANSPIYGQKMLHQQSYTPLY